MQGEKGKPINISKNRFLETPSLHLPALLIAFSSKPPAHLDALTLTWRHKSSSFAGNSLNCGCCSVLDLNIRAPSVISQKAGYKHRVFRAGIISSVFFKSSTTNIHLRPTNPVPFFFTNPLDPQLWSKHRKHEHS